MDDIQEELNGKRIYVKSHCVTCDVLPFAKSRASINVSIGVYESTYDVSDEFDQLIIVKCCCYYLICWLHHDLYKSRVARLTFSFCILG